MAETTRTTGVAHFALRRFGLALSCAIVPFGAAWAQAVPDDQETIQSYIAALTRLDRPEHN